MTPTNALVALLMRHIVAALLIGTTLSTLYSVVRAPENPSGGAHFLTRETPNPDKILDSILQGKIAASDKAKESGTRLTVAELSEIGKGIADKALVGVKFEGLPVPELLSWAKVLDHAMRFDDAVSVLDRLLKTQGTPEATFEAQLLRFQLLSKGKRLSEARKYADEITPPNEASRWRREAAKIYYIAPAIVEAEGVKQALEYVEKILKPLPQSAEDELTGRWLNIVKSNGNLFKKQYQMIGLACPDLGITKTIGDWAGLENLKGKVILIDFFAHWCGPCIASFPELQKLSTELGGKGLVVVGVTAFEGFYGTRDKLTEKEEYDLMVEFAAKHKMTWPIVFVPKSTFVTFGANTIPRVAVIDRSGKIQLIRGASTKEELAEVRSKIEACLSEK